MKIINRAKVYLKSIYLFKSFYILFNYYLFLKNKVSEQLDDTNIKFNKPKNKTIIFSLIETSHPVNFFLMLIAKILKIKGYKVFALICDQFLGACELKSIRNTKNPCFECKFNQKKIYPFFKIPIINLSEFDNKSINIKINKIVNKFKYNNYSFKRNDKFYYLNIPIDDSVTRYFYGGKFDHKHKEKISQVSTEHCKSAVYMHEISKIIDLKYKPDSIVSFMSSYTSWYPLFYYFKKKNKFRLFRFNTEFCYFDIYKFFPSINLFKQFLKQKKNQQLSLNQNTQVSKFLGLRFSSKNVSQSVYKKIEKKLQIDRKKKNIFIFPNVYWDVGLSDRGYIFKSILDWLFCTIDLIKNNSNYHIYIKPHPAEFDRAFSLWGVEKIINQKYGNSISNLSFINNSFNFSSYQLKPFIDLAVVFNGTLNLEFMLLNVPVVSTGTTSMKHLKFNQEINTISEYKKIFLSKNYDYSKFLVKDKKRLKLFAYFWFIKKNLKWNTENYYVHNLNRFKGFNFKSLDKCDFNDEQTNLILNFILKGKQLF